MKIVVGHVINQVDGSVVGTEILDTTPGAQPLPQHPTLPRLVTDMLEFLTFMNANPAARTAGGWGVVSQLPGEAAPLSRWARLVAAANSAAAEPALKALNLTGA